MLDNEPDTNQEPADDNPSQPAAIATPPRRRRAASRPAGPPATAPDAPPIEKIGPTSHLEDEPISPTVEADSQVESPAPEQGQQTQLAAPLEDPQLEVPARRIPTKKAPRTAAKRTAKKAVAQQAVATATNEDVSVAEPPKKAAPRKRAAKKVAESPVPMPTDVSLPTDAPRPPVETVSDEGSVPASESERAHEGPAGWATPAESVSTDEVPAPIQAIDDQVGRLPDSAQPEVPDESLLEPATEPRDVLSQHGWLADPFAVMAAEPQQASSPQLTAAEETSADDLVDETGAAEEDDAGDGGNRRRRRRRGGRRRRRGGADDDSGEPDSEEPTDDTESALERPAPQTDPVETEAVEQTSSEDTGEDAEGEESEGQRRRRRRRRRRGEETAALPDDPTDVVVRVREPRTRRKAASTEVTGIEGSTRMEAKRQRRKDGRDAGRRRAPILSEAEFLARRESVNRKMVIRQRDDLTQIAVLEDDILVEHYVDRDSAASLIGNVYLGRVQNVLPSMEAAFIDIGRGRNAVLYAGEVDWDSFGAEGQNRKVEKALKSGQMILVQVSKDPIGAKGARLTNHVSIPGRYIVYAPGGHLSGISRKLPDMERKRLKDILADLIGESASVIVRTAAEGASEEELVRDVNRLKAQWEDIEKKVKAGSSPQLLYGEPDLTVRIVRDLFTEDFSELLIQGNDSMNDAYDAIMGYVSHVAPHLQDRIKRWEATDGADLFAAHRLDEQIAKALERKVFLPSGGSLVIDRTEAMTVIDVNTGKFTGSGGNLEATVTSNNLEAAEEIVRQLRLRDIGGIIVIDFIDMVLPNNRDLLLRRLVECLGRDRTRHQVAEVTSLGLVQMTRKKIGTGLLEAFTTECPQCHGRGYLLHDMPVDTQQQADGGTRELRSRDHRPRPPESLTRGQQGSRNDNGSRSDIGSRDDTSSKGDNASRGDNGSTSDNEAAHERGADDSTTGSDAADRGNRSRRGRRGRGGSSPQDTGDESSDAEHAPVTSG